MHDAVIQAAGAYIRDLFRDNADGHDAEHSIRVYRSAMLIAEDYPACDRTVIALSALLHDADDHKLFHTENNANARRFLREQQVEQGRVEQICEIVNAVSFSQNRGRRPESLEGQIVQDADRLDALGAVGVARTFAYGGRHGRTLASSVRHFYEKLLLLRDELNTPRARELAGVRHAFLRQFLEEWDRETKTDGTDTLP